MHETVATILWKHHFTDGHDACRLVATDEGFALQGRSVFAHDGEHCSLSYAVQCDSAWQTRHALVSGFVGAGTIEFDIGRTVGGDWLLNGVLQPEVAGQRDLDLGFTPATNLIALRRFALAVGDEAAAPAAYLFFPEMRPPDLTLTAMAQTYRRLDRDRYDYVGTNYHAVLTIDETGFVLDYPNLWAGTLRRAKMT